MASSVGCCCNAVVIMPLRDRLIDDARPAVHGTFMWHVCVLPETTGQPRGFCPADHIFAHHEVDVHTMRWGYEQMLCPLLTGAQRCLPAHSSWWGSVSTDSRALVGLLVSVLGPQVEHNRTWQHRASDQEVRITQTRFKHHYRNSTATLVPSGLPDTPHVHGCDVIAAATSGCDGTIFRTIQPFVASKCTRAACKPMHTSLRRSLGGRLEALGWL